MLRDLLKQLGITPNLKGYEYIKTAVELLRNDSDLKYHMCKKLYPAVGRKHKTTHANAERCIRSAIEAGWESCSKMTKWVELFPVSEKPTNGHFLCELVEEISLKQSA